MAKLRFSKPPADAVSFADHQGTAWTFDLPVETDDPYIIALLRKQGLNEEEVLPEIKVELSSKTRTNVITNTKKGGEQ